MQAQKVVGTSPVESSTGGVGSVNMQNTSKVSFSFPSKAPSKHQSKPKSSDTFAEPPSSVAARDYVTEFDPAKTLTQTQSHSKHLVIPPKSNEWRPQKRVKNLLDLPSFQSDGPGHVQFEVDAGSAVFPTIESAMSYGLNLRENSVGATAEKGSEDELPRAESLDSLSARKLKEDLNRLPEDTGFEEFEEMPVEEFGKALLSGYGWHEGRGIGRNATEDVKVVQYQRRTATEGLGFIGDMAKASRNSNGIGDTAKAVNKKEEREDEGRRGGGGGGQGSYHVAKDVRVVGGREIGSKGKIIDVLNGRDSVILRLSGSEEVITVHVRDVAQLGSAEEERCLKKLKELKIRGYKDETCSVNGGRGKDMPKFQGHREGYEEERKDRKRHSKRIWEERRRVDPKVQLRADSQVHWLTSHIRVRVISKKLKGGRLYLKKAEVVDVVGPTTCDISMDESGELVQGVSQEFLETAVPRRGGPVLVLYGKHKGVFGSLLEKDTQNEAGVVYDADTKEPLNVRLEQIAEYVGDPSYIGY